jgi:hypothetical protein
MGIGFAPCIGGRHKKTGRGSEKKREFEEKRQADLDRLALKMKTKNDYHPEEITNEQFQQNQI